MGNEPVQRNVSIAADGETGRFDSAAGLASALHRVLRHAHERGARQLRWCDEDYAAWPLGDVAFVDGLTAWARGGGARELLMLGWDFDVLQRRHPRFVQWRRDFAHVVTCASPVERSDEPLPTLWVDSADQVVRVYDHVHWRGRAGVDRVDRQLAREMLDAIAQRAAPAFGASTLGL